MNSTINITQARKSTQQLSNSQKQNPQPSLTSANSSFLALQYCNLINKKYLGWTCPPKINHQNHSTNKDSD